MATPWDNFPAISTLEETKRKVDTEFARTRNRHQEVEAALMAIRGTDQTLSALAAFQSEASPATIDREALCREYEDLERRLLFLQKARDEANRELDRARSFASAEICKAARPAFVAVVKKKLAAKRADAEANRELRKIRDQLEAQGVKTGTLPYATDGIEERYELYCKMISQDFPEL